MTEADSQQTPLPGLEPGEPDEWILTVEDAGLEYMVLVEAMTRTKARETFQADFEMYELSLKDDEFDWDHETVFAKSADNAEAIALERTPDEIGREYMRVCECTGLGNTADIKSVDHADNADIDGWKARRATREAEVVDR